MIGYSVKMNLLYRLVFFVICLPLANFASMPLENGCESEFDIQDCVIKMYCRNNIYWESYHNFYAKNSYYTYDYNNFVTNCDDGSVNTKIVLVYECADINQCDDSHDMPVVNNQENLQSIYMLDLSNQYYYFNPKFSKMEQLNYLNLSHNYITIAKLSNDINLISLKEIDYSFNTITNFNVSGEKFKNLTTLNVSHNKISKLPDGVFDGFSKLTNLDLSYNCIVELRIETFEGIKGLIYLNLSHNNIADINTSMFRFKQLRHLNLSNNKIQTLSTQSLINLQNVDVLDVSFNTITRIEKTAFRGMLLLKSLNLAHNYIDLVDKNIFLNNTHLCDVDFSFNNIHSFPKYVFKNKTIISFSLEENKLEGPLVKGTFSGLELVTNLNLNSHLLSSINDFAFFGLEKLTWLSINNNKIDLLTKKSFRTLFNLMYLDLSNNKIADLSFEKDDLVSLRHLSLQNNYLIQIKHDDFVRLNTLFFLNIAYNNISELEPQLFQSLQDLSYFEISNNPLTGIIKEGTFVGLSSLPKLDISDTKLTTITNNSFDGMIQLKDLNVSHGLIDTIEYNTFINTGHIESIDLSYNRLSTFSVNSEHLSHLTTLNLNNNMFTEVTDSTFKGLYNLAIVDLGHNIIQRISNDVFKDQMDLRNLNLSYNNAMRFTVSILKYNKILNTLLLSGLDNQLFLSEEVLIPIKKLELAEDKIKHISTLNLRTMLQLEIVILKYNNISDLSIGDFSDTKSLKSIDLSFNKITTIQPNVFEHNSLLTFLNVSHNMISELKYGIFQGLVNLNILDLSFNHINDLKSERFYELQNLNKLIVDHNNIDSFDAFEFNALGELSIGENPLSCDILIKLNETGTPFKLTAVNIEKSRESFNGITCNVNKKSTINIPFSNPDYTKFAENDKVLIEIRDELVKIANEQKSQTSKTVESDNNSKSNLDMPHEILNEDIKQLIQLMNFSSAIMIKETNNTNNLLHNILKKISDYRITTVIPFNKDNATLDNVLTYINRIKQEMEDFMASEKQNIVDDLNSKLSSLKAHILYEKVSTIAPTPKLSQQIDNNDKSGSVFTEICVGLILVILVCYILYKFYKSKLFIRPRRSSSTRELEIPNL